MYYVFMNLIGGWNLNKSLKLNNVKRHWYIEKYLKCVVNKAFESDTQTEDSQIKYSFKSVCMIYLFWNF